MSLGVVGDTYSNFAGTRSVTGSRSSLASSSFESKVRDIYAISNKQVL